MTQATWGIQSLAIAFHEEKVVLFGVWEFH